MTNVTKTGEDKAASTTATEIAKKVDGELSEAELDKVSGGPTAVEMPGHFVMGDGSVRNLLPGQVMHGGGGGAG